MLFKIKNQENLFNDEKLAFVFFFLNTANKVFKKNIFLIIFTDFLWLFLKNNYINI